MMNDIITVAGHVVNLRNGSGSIAEFLDIFLIQDIFKISDFKHILSAKLVVDILHTTVGFLVTLNIFTIEEIFITDQIGMDFLFRHININRKNILAAERLNQICCQYHTTFDNDLAIQIKNVSTDLHAGTQCIDIMCS